MDTGAPFERVATCWTFSLWVVRKGGATGRMHFVRHQNGLTASEWRMKGNHALPHSNLTYGQGKRLRSVSPRNSLARPCGGPRGVPTRETPRGSRRARHPV